MEHTYRFALDAGPQLGACGWGKACITEKSLIAFPMSNAKHDSRVNALHLDTGNYNRPGKTCRRSNEHVGESSLVNKVSLPGHLTAPPPELIAASSSRKAGAFGSGVLLGGGAQSC